MWKLGTLMLALALTACGGAVTDSTSYSAPEVGSRAAIPTPTREASPPEQSPPPMRSVPREVELWVAAEDADLRELLEPAVAHWTARGHAVEFRDRCHAGIPCLDAWWEGAPLPNRWRVACPADTPLRRELSVDVAVSGGLDVAVGVALFGGCEETAAWWSPSKEAL